MSGTDVPGPLLVLPARRERGCQRAARHDEDDDEPLDEREESSYGSRRHSVRGDDESFQEKPSRRPRSYEDDYEGKRRLRRAREKEEVGRRISKRPFFSGDVIFLIVLGVITLAAVGVRFIFPSMLVKIMIYCSILSALGGIWLLGVAFQESTLHGMGYLFVGLVYGAIAIFVPMGGVFTLFFPNVYGALVAVLCFEEAKKPFFLHCMGSFLLLVLFLTIDDNPRPAGRRPDPLADAGKT